MTDPNPSHQDVQNAVQEKMAAVDEVASELHEKLTARDECYKRITDSAKAAMTEYYTRYPDRAIDDRSADATDWSVAGIRAILSILGDYTISYRDERNPIPKGEQNEQQPAKSVTQPGAPDSAQHGNP